MLRSHAGCDERISIYKCYNRTQHKDQCDGPTTYRAQKVDEVVESILRSIFQKAKSVDSQKLLERQTGAATDDAQKQLKKARVELQKSTKELAKWEDLMLDSIEGTCVFTPEQIKKRMFRYSYIKACFCHNGSHISLSKGFFLMLNGYCHVLA